jgi:hypothetical protein
MHGLFRLAGPSHAHEIVKARSYRTKEGTMELIELKNNMNSKRTIFNWSHLDPYH